MNINLTASLAMKISTGNSVSLEVVLTNNSDKNCFIALEDFNLSSNHCGNPSIKIFGPLKTFLFFSTPEIDCSINFCRNSPEEFDRTYIESIRGLKVSELLGVDIDLSWCVQKPLAGLYKIQLSADTWPCVDADCLVHYDSIKLLGVTEFKV